MGSAHYETIGDGKKSQAAEVITLSLTFDHRVVNGAGAASFVHKIKEQIENFQFPVATALSPAGLTQRSQRFATQRRSRLRNSL